MFNYKTKFDTQRVAVSMFSYINMVTEALCLKRSKWKLLVRKDGKQIPSTSLSQNWLQQNFSATSLFWTRWWHNASFRTWKVAFDPSLAFQWSSIWYTFSDKSSILSKASSLASFMSNLRPSFLQYSERMFCASSSSAFSDGLPSLTEII